MSGFAGQRVLVLSVGWKEEENKRTRIVSVKHVSTVLIHGTSLVNDMLHIEQFRNTMVVYLLFRSCLFSRQITHT